MFCAVGFLYIYDRELDIKQSDFYDFGSLSMPFLFLKPIPLCSMYGLKTQL